MKNKFCVLPWNSINLRNNGDMRVCCNANSYTENRGILRHDDKTPYNAGKDNWEDARNSKLLKEIRVSMMNDEWHHECERCRQEELSGSKSRRIYEMENYDLSAVKAFKHTKEDGTIDTNTLPIKYLDLRYGNFCNLKCRMCGPTDSHMWYPDQVKLGGPEYIDTHEKIELVQNDNGKWYTDQYDWFKNAEHYWNQLEENFSSVEKLYIVGGEPLIIDEHYETLQWIIDKGFAENIEIEYNTNLTNIPDRVLKYWEHFAEVRIGASVDGYGKVFEYQRPPAKWDKVYSNMLKLNDNCYINLRLWTAFTITVYNVYHLPEFMKWKLEESKLDHFNPPYRRAILTEHFCHGPKHLNIKVLPDYIKDELKDIYEDAIDWVKDSDHHPKIKKSFERILRSTIKFMMSESYTETHYEKFVEWTKDLDEIRGQNVVDVIPEYKDLFV